MNRYIAYCGLDCQRCDAYLATLNDDNELRIKVAALWSKLNGVEITPEMINCVGCRQEGAKTPFCESLCQIRKCATGKALSTCGACKAMEKCEKLAMITKNNEVALCNLKNEESR